VKFVPPAQAAAEQRLAAAAKRLWGQSVQGKGIRRRGLEKRAIGGRSLKSGRDRRDSRAAPEDCVGGAGHSHIHVGDARWTE